MSFFQQLQDQTVAERDMLFAAPIIQQALAGKVVLPSYIAFLTEAYHHVSHTVPLMQLAKSRLDGSHAAYRDALDEYISEETGHEQWILNDITAAGGDAASVVREGPNAATEMMVAFAYDYVSRVNPMGFFGMVFVLEGVSTQLASVGAGAVRASLGLPKEAFTYLVSHGALDVHHLAFLKDLLDGVESAEDRAAITHMARRMFGLFGDVFRSIPHVPAAELADAV